MAAASPSAKQYSAAAGHGSAQANETVQRVSDKYFGGRPPTKQEVQAKKAELQSQLDAVDRKLRTVRKKHDKLAHGTAHLRESLSRGSPKAVSRKATRPEVAGEEEADEGQQNGTQSLYSLGTNTASMPDLSSPAAKQARAFFAARRQGRAMASLLSDLSGTVKFATSTVSHDMLQYRPESVRKDAEVMWEFRKPRYTTEVTEFVDVVIRQGMKPFQSTAMKP